MTSCGKLVRSIVLSRVNSLFQRSQPVVRGVARTVALAWGKGGSGRPGVLALLTALLTEAHWVAIFPYKTSLHVFHSAFTLNR